MSDGEVSKGILHTDIYPLLSEKVRIVFLVSKNKADFFATQITGDSIIEIMPTADSPRLEEWLLDLFLFSVPTESIKVKIEYTRALGGSLAAKYIKYLLWFAGHVRLYRALCRLVYQLLTDRSLNALFEKYNPELVFAANLTSLEDARLIKAAHRRGVPSVGMPKGWDNLTLKTLLPVFPDVLLVQTPVMKRDAEKLDYPPDKISVVGFPKFDVYADTSLLKSREEFMRALKLDPTKKMILYAGAGDVLAPHDEEVLAALLQAIESGRVLGEPQVVVRPHPKYLYRIEIIPPKSFWAYDRPGTVVGPRAMDFEFNKSDIDHLMNSLFHADLLIHTASTLGIESAIFDRPTITIGYDGDTKPVHAYSTARYYDYEHYARVIATGGMHVAHSTDELISFTNQYLRDPAKDREGRRQIVDENTYKVGGAGKRVAEAILSVLRI